MDGYGFRDMSGGVDSTYQQGLFCKFGPGAMVPATLARLELSGSIARCASPSDAAWSGGGVGGGAVLQQRPLELTFNGEDAALTISSSGVPFTYYEPTAFNVSSIFPLGGPTAGATAISVYLTDPAFLVDLGGGDHGVFCRFSRTETYGEFAHAVVEWVHTITNASLRDCLGASTCGGGRGYIACESPQFNGTLSPESDGRDVTVEVSINGQNFTDSGVVFRYYDPSVWRVHSFGPRGGPMGGNTSVVVSGMRFEPLGPTRCRFGELNLEVNSTVDDPRTLRIVSPAHWNSGGQRWNLRAASQQVEIACTLNGQQYLHTLPHRSTYTYYSVGDAPYALSVRRLDPIGGPASGGTLVELTGTGFDDFGVRRPPTQIWQRPSSLPPPTTHEEGSSHPRAQI